MHRNVLVIHGYLVVNRNVFVIFIPETFPCFYLPMKTSDPAAQPLLNQSDFTKG